MDDNYFCRSCCVSCEFTGALLNELADEASAGLQDAACRPVPMLTVSTRSPRERANSPRTLRRGPRARAARFQRSPRSHDRVTARSRREGAAPRCLAIPSEPARPAHDAREAREWYDCARWRLLISPSIALLAGFPWGLVGLGVGVVFMLLALFANSNPYGLEECVKALDS